MSKRAIGYIRVSSVGGRSGPGYHTLDIQRHSIERTAQFHRYELVDVLTDEDQSGKTRQRPMFQEAMRRVLADDADALIVWKVSRFSRNWREAAEDVETLLNANKDLLSEEGFDTATAGGRLLLRILFSMANWEHDVLGEHWEVIKDKAVRDRGSWLGVPPLGYRSGPGGVLEPDEHASEVVELFKARAAGQPWGHLAERLDVIRPRPGGSRHDSKDARRIIQSRVYLGEVRWRGQVNAAAHEPLVTVEIFEQANRTPDDMAGRQRRERRREFPLSGWLRCSGCGGPMAGSTVKDPRGVLRGNYVCSRRRDGGCPSPQSISADAAERWAMSQVETLHQAARFEEIATDGRNAQRLERRAQVEAALHDLASVDMRRELGEDWLPMMRKLRAEKAEIDAATVSAPLGRTVSWEDLDEAGRWVRLRDIAPHGALVGPALGRGRHGRPADRLGFIDPAQTDAELRLEGES